jgi:hypothetical protein
MRPDALLVAWKKDYHAQAVRARFADSGLTAVIIDTGDYPSLMSLSWFLDDTSQELVIFDQSDGELCIGPCTGVW